MFTHRDWGIAFSLMAILIVAVIVLSSLNLSLPGEKAPQAKKDTTVIIVPRRFGLALDSFNVTESIIQKNEYLNSILELYNVDSNTIKSLQSKSKYVYDVRKMKAGSQYTVFSTKDTLHKVCYFVYQPNAIDYVLYDLTDSVKVVTGKRQVTARLETASGIINGSLYETFQKSGTDPALAMKLADLYAYTVDFYSIHDGDYFKVLYEQRYIKDEPVETGAIQSAVFSHNGEKFYAFYYRSDSTDAGDYYDEKGKSLRTLFLKAPLKFSHITSGYSLRRFHPVQKRWKTHLGTDYAAPEGTPIIATGDGVVIESEYNNNNGNFVKIKHDDTYTTQYLHMTKQAVRAGQSVRQGQVIGYVGSTGLATGPHVCYRFWKSGKQVNPLQQTFPPSVPLPDSVMTRFGEYVLKQQQQLNTVNVGAVQSLSMN
ncbi:MULTISPECIES: M23 family metallopeptidase [Niastella]|uniref:Peptidoglycan DD-metalloendopeptidase family protein n=1 Tax=Niastella soli TaxID=2821487 RepID=A0ABS3YQ06_9BACT|nr:peptidoglycan DD-metalloendopeptidase family protein [Niastella soli]MBO9199903.1 peptidoglycan DD-metalloendopeptidase family protein [Niastella soli]